MARRQRRGRQHQRAKPRTAPFTESPAAFGPGPEPPVLRAPFAAQSNPVPRILLLLAKLELVRHEPSFRIRCNMRCLIGIRRLNGVFFAHAQGMDAVTRTAG